MLLISQAASDSRRRSILPLADSYYLHTMHFSLLQLLRDIPLAVVDVETTGASADFGHRIIELGIVRLERGRIVEEYQQLINPERRISPGVTALTGITHAMVQDQPTFDQQLPAALRVLSGAIVLGHNVRFDLSFLRKEFRRSRREIVQALSDAPVMDTVRIARRRFGRGGNALQRLAPRMGITPPIAHRALADAQTTAALFQKLMEPVGGWDTCLCDAFAQQGGPMGLLPINPRQSLLPLQLEEALEQKCPVMLEYLDGQENRTHRKVEPLHVRRRNGELLLVAHCHLRNSRRTFKLERVVQITRVEEQSPLGLTKPVGQAPDTAVTVAPAPISDAALRSA
jgi:DNA polymerase III epsilon subunit family exonuclease